MYSITLCTIRDWPTLGALKGVKLQIDNRLKNNKKYIKYKLMYIKKTAGTSQ